MAKELDNKKMWESFIEYKGLPIEMRNAIHLALEDQGLKWNGKEIVEINETPDSKNIGDYDHEAVYDSLVEQGQKNTHKFKEGDFIVNDYCCGKVVELTEDAYLLDTEQGIPFSYEHNARLWDITKDAKDGDVLATSAGAFIYNGNNGGGSCPGSYCGIDTLGKFRTGVKHHWTGKKVTPATKEQRDLLFAKMKEAGYKWDAEKKELMKSTRILSAEVKEAAMKAISKQEAIKSLKELFDYASHKDNKEVIVVEEDGNAIFLIDKRYRERFEVIDKLQEFFADKYIEGGQVRVGSITLLYTQFIIEDRTIKEGGEND